MDNIQEAATIKAMAKSALNALALMLGDKSIPAGLRSQIKNLQDNMQKTWTDLEAEAAYDPTPATEAKREETETKEAQIDIESDLIPLSEASVRKDGTAEIKIIAPGWGSSGYYSADVLKRDGAKVFTPGVKMYIDHPTRTQEAERPERSITELAGELTTPARWVDNHPQGAGLYADAKIFPQFKETLQAIAPHIGVSIRALGRAQAGDAEGRKGSVIQEISSARSVDFVTQPGAGGKVVALMESMRSNPQMTQITQIREEKNMNDEVQEKVMEVNMTELEESNVRLEAENARLKEALLLREARDIVSAKVASLKLPAMTVARLVESLSKNPVVKDGKIDEAAFNKQIDEAVKAEIEYISKVSGGIVKGLGESEKAPPVTDYTADMESAFKRIGLSESAAKVAANGRV
jgi:hypothetical protein